MGKVYSNVKINFFFLPRRVLGLENSYIGHLEFLLTLTSVGGNQCRKRQRGICLRAISSTLLVNLIFETGLT